LKFETSSKIPLPKEDYANAVISAFNEGTNNWLGSPSLHSVKTIRGIVKAAIVRQKSNPSLLLASTAKPASGGDAKPLLFPPQITLGWLIEHMPIGHWRALVSSYVAVFLLGATIGPRLMRLLGF
jgi:hypothetical protein